LQSIANKKSTIGKYPIRGYARIKRGAVVWMDFSSWTWPDLPHGDLGIIFEVSKHPAPHGRLDLRADYFGFFGDRGHYGNGSLFVREEDVEWVNTELGVPGRKVKL